MSWTSYLPTIIPLVTAGVIALIGYAVAEWVANMVRQRGAMPYQVRGARVIITSLALVIAGLVLFFAFGSINEVSGLTFSAILTLAATLALQTTIGNVIAGFILLRNRLLRIDDEIQISGIQGRVVQLGMVTTWLRREDGSLVSVSNSTLLGGPLVNRTAGERLKGEF